MSSVKINNASVKCVSSASVKAQFSFIWSLKPLARAVWTDVAYGPINTLVAVGSNRSAYSTTNGDTWSNTITPINPNVGNESYNALCYGSNGTWSLIESLAYLPSGSRYSYTSVDPVTGWTSNTLTHPLSVLDYYDVLYSSYHNKYIAIGHNAGRATNNIVGMYATDAVNWLSASYISSTGNAIVDSNGFTGGIIEGIDMPNNRLVATGFAANHKFAYSDDGVTWKQGNYGPQLKAGHNWTDVAYGHNNSNLPLSGRYVAVNTDGGGAQFQFAYSDNGIDWTGVGYTSSDLRRNWSTIAYGNGYFVAIAFNAQAMSRDGKNWFAFQNLPSSVRHSDVEVANNRFVALLSNDTVNNVGCSTADFSF